MMLIMVALRFIVLQSVINKLSNCKVDGVHSFNSPTICYGCITVPDGNYHSYDLPITYTTTYDAVFTPVSPEAVPTLAASTQFTWNKTDSTMSTFLVALTGNSVTWKLSYIIIGY